jgi:hypothetical protein
MAREGGGVVIENPDHRVHDAVALDEIELYGNLMIAAAESDGPLSQDQIDEILGVRIRGDAAAEAATRAADTRAQPPAVDEPTAAASRG